ncbi:MAG: hypothetical protein IKL07_09595, partial [Clostridium sp.]|nr:hypothetical protein [Clostridium sp.]
YPIAERNDLHKDHCLHHKLGSAGKSSHTGRYSWHGKIKGFLRDVNPQVIGQGDDDVLNALDRYFESDESKEWQH